MPIFEIWSNIEFTKIIKYPEHKSPNISDREKVIVQEKEGDLRGSKILEKAREWLDPEYKQRDLSKDILFLIAKGKAEYRMLRLLSVHLYVLEQIT